MGSKGSGGHRMKVKRENLLVIAGVIWMIAGINILIIGLGTYAAVLDLAWWIIGLLAVGTVIVLGMFHTMFGKLVKKHVKRISSMEGERQNPLLFFDLKSYLIMAFMITFGVALRVSGVIPDWGIAFFYTGLGTALILAGVGFILYRINGSEWRFHRNRVHAS